MRLLLCACVLAIALPLRAAPNEQKEIQELYRRGLQGDKEAVVQCIEKLERVLAREPQNQVARVYLGSAFTLRSRDLRFGPRKLQTLRQGLAVMDEAVAAVPDDPKVRLARALTTSALPGFFGRKSQSRQDFEILREIAAKNPEKFERADLEAIRANTEAEQ